jgi:hypothetical protein
LTRVSPASPSSCTRMQYQASAASKDGRRIGEGEHAHAKEVLRATIRSA